MLRSRFGPARVLSLDQLLESAPVRVNPVDVAQARAARDADQSLGKGWHPAGLNLGDCFCCALALVRAEPLLCHGAGFAATDVELALAPRPG